MSVEKPTESIGSDWEQENMETGKIPLEQHEEEASASTESRNEVGLDTMFDQLAIDESEFDDFVIEEDEATLLASTRWMAVARV
jgi:hypothetical protein